jgi:hypothetical protein
MDIAWSYSMADAGLLDESQEDPRFQLLKSEGRDPDYNVVYEGEDMRTVVDGLKPQTLYKFKLRVWNPSLHSFSKDYTEVSATTSGRFWNASSFKLCTFAFFV